MTLNLLLYAKNFLSPKEVARQRQSLSLQATT
jgi:hypothetical protein